MWACTRVGQECARVWLGSVRAPSLAGGRVEDAVSAVWSDFYFPFCPQMLSLGGSTLPHTHLLALGRTLIFVTGLCLACVPCPLFCRVPVAQVVLGRSRMKGGRGQGGRSELPWDHVILLSSGQLVVPG